MCHRDCLTQQKNIGSSRNAWVRAKAEVHNSAGHRSDSQPGLITGRSQQPLQVGGRRNHDTQLIRTRPARFRYRSCVHIRSRQFQDRVVAPVGGEDVPRTVYRYVCGAGQSRKGKRYDRPRRGLPFLNQHVTTIGDVDVPRTVYCHAPWIAYSSDECCDRSRCGVPFLHHVVTTVGDVDISRTVYRHSNGMQSAGERCDRPGRDVPFLQRAVKRIGDVDVPRSVHCDAIGTTQSCGDERCDCPCRGVPFFNCIV